MPPIVAHGNGGNTAPIPTRPKKQRKVRSRADTSMPTTTRVLGVATSPLLQRMVGIFLKETQPLSRGKHRMTVAAVFFFYEWRLFFWGPLVCVGGSC